MSAFLLAYTFLIGFSRVYINVHYVGDVLGGWLASIVVFSILLCLFNLFLVQKDHYDEHEKRNYLNHSFFLFLNIRSLPKVTGYR